MNCFSQASAKSANQRRWPARGQGGMERGGGEKSKACVDSGMSDPRNVAHNKKVNQEKAHQESASGAGARPKKKKQGPKAEGLATPEDANKQTAAPEKTPAEQSPGNYEKSQTVLSKLKELEFHSRANIETLAQLILTIEEELKQKEFSGPIGDIYAAQDGFHTRIAQLIESYEKKIETLRPST
jgi:hypothetical protein